MVHVPSGEEVEVLITDVAWSAATGENQLVSATDPRVMAVAEALATADDYFLTPAGEARMAHLDLIRDVIEALS